MFARRYLAILQDQIHIDQTAIVRRKPWLHFVLDNFLDKDFFRYVQDELIKADIRYSIKEGDLQEVEYALLEHIPLARVFYSIDFLRLLEKLVERPLELNASNAVQLRRMRPDSPAFPTHIDSLKENASLVVIFYYGPVTKSGIGGELYLVPELRSPVRDSVIISPVPNRLVILESNETSWHGIRRVRHNDRLSILSEWFLR